MPSGFYALLVFLYFFLCFFAINEGSARKARKSQKSKPLTFEGSQSYAIYENWKPLPHGAIQLDFKTGNKDAFLLYMDDMGQREFIDLFLVNGSVRLRLTVGQCVMSRTFVYGQFHDYRWHRVRVDIQEDQTILEVDGNLYSKPINCTGHTTFRVNSKIYVGSFNFSPNISSQDFALGYQILLETKMSSFRGCIRDVSYRKKKEKFARINLLETTAKTGCQNACKEPTINKCKRGTRCINKIFTVECRCPGGHCAAEIPTSAMVKPTPSYANLTSFSLEYSNSSENLTIKTKYLRNNVQGLRFNWLLVVLVPYLLSIQRIVVK